MNTQLKRQDSDKNGSSNQFFKIMFSVLGFFFLASILFSIKNQPPLTEEDVFILLQRGNVISMKLQPASMYDKKEYIIGIKNLMEDQSELFKSGNLTIKLGFDR